VPFRYIRRLCPIGIYRVSGASMQPGYEPGDTLLGLRWFRPRPGQVVVLRRDRPLIKRVGRLDDGRVWLLGDNRAHSTDSRHFGPVREFELEARIIAKLP
jgi:phage repressor protein C with HTH and peptisase S24 domain